MSQSTDLHLPLLLQKPVISVLKRGAVPLVPKKQDIVTAQVCTGLAFLTSAPLSTFGPPSINSEGVDHFFDSTHCDTILHGERQAASIESVW